jgi:hypothetical protein
VSIFVHPFQKGGQKALTGSVSIGIGIGENPGLKGRQNEKKKNLIPVLAQDWLTRK